MHFSLYLFLRCNESKPVSASRDNQELNFEAGLRVLEIYKDSPQVSQVLNNVLFGNTPHQHVVQYATQFDQIPNLGQPPQAPQVKPKGTYVFDDQEERERDEQLFKQIEKKTKDQQNLFEKFSMIVPQKPKQKPLQAQQPFYEDY